MILSKRFLTQRDCPAAAAFGLGIFRVVEIDYSQGVPQFRNARISRPELGSQLHGLHEDVFCFVVIAFLYGLFQRADLDRVAYHPLDEDGEKVGQNEERRTQEYVLVLDDKPAAKREAGYLSKQQQQKERRFHREGSPNRSG